MAQDTMEKPFHTEKLIPGYFRLALPVVFSMVITLIYNLADTCFIAKTNDPMLVAGVSLCAPLFMLLMALGNVFGQGGSALISRLLGGGASDRARAVSAFCFYASIGIGVAVPSRCCCSGRAFSAFWGPARIPTATRRRITAPSRFRPRW